MYRIPRFFLATTFGAAAAAAAMIFGATTPSAGGSDGLFGSATRPALADQAGRCNQEAVKQSLEAQKRQIDLRKHDIDEQYRGPGNEQYREQLKQQLEAQKRDIDAQKRALDRQKHDCETRYHSHSAPLHPGHQNGYGNTVNGVVTSVNGNLAQVRQDNGGTVAVNTNGTPLNVGQHYNLNGCYQGSVFVLGCASSGNYPGGYSQQISGTILSSSGDTLTLVGLPPVQIDISQARARGAISGSLTPLRHITAYGYSQNGTFFATRIQ